MARWLIPLLCNMLLLMPYINIFDDLRRFVIKNVFFTPLYWLFGFGLCFIFVVSKKTDGWFWIASEAIVTGLMLLLMFIDRHSIFEFTDVPGGFLGDEFSILFLQFVNFWVQFAAIVLAMLVMYIKNRRNKTAGTSDVPAAEIADVEADAETVQADGEAAAAGKAVRSEGMKIFLTVFITVFFATLLIHFLPDLIYRSARDNYADSHYISESNVDEFSGSDMWAEVLDRSDEFGIHSVRTSCRKDNADHSGDYRAEIDLISMKKEDLILETKEIMGFISDHLSKNPECEINKFNSITFSFSAGRDRIDISDNWLNEKLDGFDCVIIYNDHYHDYEVGPQLSDLPEFDGYRYIKATVPLDLESDLSVMKKMENTEKIVLRIVANETDTKKLEQKAADLGLDGKVSFS